jgi:hypothetical protein
LPIQYERSLAAFGVAAVQPMLMVCVCECVCVCVCVCVVLDDGRLQMRGQNVRHLDCLGYCALCH